MNGCPMVERCARVQQSEKNIEPAAPSRVWPIWYEERGRPGGGYWQSTIWLSVKEDTVPWWITS